MRERVAAVGIDAAGGSPEEFGSLVRADIATWTKVVKTTGVRID